jgi:hypothetical protein
MVDEQPDAPAWLEGQEKPKRDALGRFPPGVSGNPHGPGAGHLSLTTTLKRILRQRVSPNDPTDLRTMGDQLMEAAVEHARAGNASFFKELIDRLEGKVPDRFEAKLGGDWTMEYDAVDEAQTTPTDAHGDDDA